MKKLYFISIFLLGIALTAGAQAWEVYDGSVLPVNSNDGIQMNISNVNDNSPGAGLLVEVIDDTENAGNKILKYFNPDGKTTYRYDFPAEFADTAYTLIARLKGNGDGVAYDRVFDMRWDNSTQGTRDEIRIWYDGRVEIEKADVNVQMGSSWDPSAWHTYRISVSGNVSTVYIDEVPTALISGTTTSSTTNNYMKFGDGSGDNVGGFVDWIAVDMSGAYAPGEGTAIPDSLLMGSLSADADLASLTPSVGTLVPDFDPTVTSYDLELPVGSTNVNLTAEANYFASTIAGDGLIDAPGTATVTVSAQDGTQKSYSVAITIAVNLSDDASLSSLTSSAGTLDPAFDAGVYAYALVLPYGTANVTLTGSATHANASVAGDGEVVAPGTTTVTVTAEDGTTTLDYVVTITVTAPSTDATLSSLTASKGTLDPAFSPTTLSYALELPAESTSVIFDASATDNNATVTGTGLFNSLPGTATIAVTAEDGTTISEYVINVTVSTVGVSLEAGNGFGVYPNPASDLFTIEGRAGTKVSVINSVGAMISSFTMQSDREVVGTDAYQKGVYFVRMDTPENVIVKKLLIK